MVKVLDMNGVEIKNGDTVLVHQDSGVSKAIVTNIFSGALPLPTTIPGYWIDIDKGGGPEGMMSYILEVINGD